MESDQPDRTCPSHGREVVSHRRASHDASMKRASVALMLIGFGSLSSGCYERPDPLSGGTEMTGSTTMPQASSSGEPATSSTTTTTSMTSMSTSSGAGPTTDASESDPGSTTETPGTETSTTAGEDTSSSTGSGFEDCDPLVQNCGRGEGCYADGEAFGCQEDASGANGGQADACAADNECTLGLLCLNAEVVGSCEDGSAGCCSAVCDLSAPECPNSSPNCIPWYDPGPAPSGLEDVGACVAT